MRLSKFVRESLPAVLVPAALVAFGTAVTAAPDPPAGARPGAATGLPEPESMFLTGVVLLALAFVARQIVRKNGSRSAS